MVAIMGERKNLMKENLSDSLRDIMLQRDFEKITIKMICSETGVIRATFYNHFIDKYDALDYIVYRDVFETGKTYCQNKSYFEGLEEIIHIINENRDFYRRAFTIDGQNSFREMLMQHFINLFLLSLKKGEQSISLDENIIAHYYASSLVSSIQVWVQSSEEMSEKSFVEIYRKLVTLDINDVLS